MSKKSLLLLMMSLAVLLVLFLLLFHMQVLITDSRFEEDHRTIHNPDRGFYIQVDSSRYDKMPKIAKEVRLILLAYDIREYQNCDLPDEKLQELKFALEAAKTEHLSVIFRAAYGFDETVAEPDQIDQIGRHIEQISKILNEYLPQISVVQAGLLGAYGEWHDGKYLQGDEEKQREYRAYVLTQWENDLDPHIKVALRRPRFIREAESQGILVDRLSLHNDALLSTDSDMGTYDDPQMPFAAELDWMKEKLSGQYNGGEMPRISARSQPLQADAEFQKLHLSYLNLKYNEEVLNLWKEMPISQNNFNGSAFDFIETRLGYRFSVSEIVRKETLFSNYFGRTVHLEIRMKNSGYACLPQKYKVYLLLEDCAGNSLEQYELKNPKMYQVCNGEHVTVHADIPIDWTSKETQDGVLLKLKIAPDIQNSENADCVAFANEAFFPYADGENELIHMQPADSFLKGRTVIHFVKRNKDETC